jgi:hypothetical protein
MVVTVLFSLISVLVIRAYFSRVPEKMSLYPLLSTCIALPFRLTQLRSYIQGLMIADAGQKATSGECLRTHRM